MATAVSDIFKVTMAIMDELSSNGEAVTSDTEEYKNRAVPILNILIGECYPYSQENKGDRNKFRAVTSFDDYVTGIDKVLAIAVIPYGLAANLLVDENPTSASFFQQRYEELLARFGRERLGEWEAIEDVYSTTNEYNNFARW